MEKLALAAVPALLARLGRPTAGPRIIAECVACSIVGLAATLLVGMVRYVVLLAVYVEHDGILAGSAGQAALDLFTSPWITCFFLFVAGLAADRAAGWFADGRRRASPCPTGCPDDRARLRAAIALLARPQRVGFDCSFPPGSEKPGRILIDDRFCGIWEPTARQLDTRVVRRFPHVQLHLARRVAGQMVLGRCEHDAAATTTSCCRSMTC